jgi:hypothetical protein
MRQQINLYQSIFRKQRQVFSAAAMAQALGVVAAALVAIHAYGVASVGALEGEVAQLEGREMALTTQLGRMDPALSATRRAELDAELKRLNATLAGQQRLIDALRQQPLGDGTGFSGYLAALSRQRTPELWLTAIAIGSTGAIELEGRSLSPGGVPEFMRRLGNEAVLANQRFDRFEIERDEESGESIFRVTSRTGLMLAATGGEPRP